MNTTLLSPLTRNFSPTGILAVLWFALSAIPTHGQAVFQFDRHELTIGNFGTSYDGCGIKSPITQTIKTASGSTSVDGTQFSCSPNIMLKNLSLVLNFPNTVTGRAGPGGLVLDSPITPSAALKGTWTWSYTPASPSSPAPQVSMWNAGGFVGCYGYSDSQKIAAPGDYSIPNFKESSCQMTAVSLSKFNEAEIDGSAKSEFSALDAYAPVTFRKSTGPDIEIKTFYKPVTGPVITLDPTSLDFGVVGDVAEQKTVRLSNSGIGTLNWKAELSTGGAAAPSRADLASGWLIVNPASGSLAQGASATLTVTVDPAGLSSGNNIGKITISSPDASNSPQEISVRAATTGGTADSLILSNEVPKEGTVLKEETTQGFSAKVKYALGSRSSALLSLRVFNEKDVLQGASAFANVSRSNGTGELEMTVPAFKIVKGTTKLQLKAVMIYAETTILATSYVVTYSVRSDASARIQSVKVFWGEQKTGRVDTFFDEFHGTTSHLHGGSKLRTSSPNERPPDLAIEIIFDHAGKSGKIELMLNEWRYAKSGEREDLRVASLAIHDVGSGTEQKEYIWLSGDQMVYTDADSWSFAAVLDPSDGSEPVKAESKPLPVQRLHIVPKGYSPLLTAKLIKGETVDFSFELEYNQMGPGVQLHAEVSPIGSSGFFKPGLYTSADVDSVDGSMELRGVFTWTFEYTIPDNAVLIAVVFTDFFHEVQSKYVVYNKLQSPDTTVSSTAGQVAGALGLDVKTVQNAANKVVKFIRTAGDIASSGLLKSGSAAPGAVPEAAGTFGEVRALADPFKDFLAINAFWQIDPPVPGTSSTPFGSQPSTFDVTLSYTADDLPDDPNFRESALKVVSYDTTTGKLTSYDTVVDTANKTATARVDGLGPYISAGVLGPFSRQSLDFPILRSTGSLYNGIGLLNLGKETASFSLTAYSDDGSTKTGTGVTNPATATLAPGQQVPKLAQQFFNFVQSSNTGWVQVRSDKNSVVGFELLGSDTVLDGADVSGTHASSVVLTDIEYDSTTTTEVQIANPTNFPVVMTLELRTNSPAAVGSTEVVLQPREKLSRRIQDLFSPLASPFLGYLIVKADHPVVASEILTSGTSIAMLNAQTLVEGSATATKLYSAQLAHGGNAYYTRFNIVNPTTLTTNLTVRAVNEGGGSLASPVSITLGPGQQYLRDAGQMFGLGSASLVVGSIIVDSTIAGVVGDVSFGDPTGTAEFRTSLPLDSNPSNFAAFAQVANGAGYFTGFAAFNPNATSAGVDLKIYKADGTLTGTSRFSLPAGGRLSKLLPELVPLSGGQVGGYFTLTADQTITSFAVFGTTTLSALSAVPPLGREFTGTVSPPTTTCNLYGEDFDGGTALGWTVSSDTSTWQVTGGKLQVSAIQGNRTAEATHPLPVPNFFKLTMDVETDNFNGTFYGFEAYSDIQPFNLITATGTIKIDGLGVAVTSAGQAGFLGYDVDRTTFVILNATNYGSVSSLGVEWTSTGVVLLINGTARQTLPAVAFGQPVLVAPSIDKLGLYATGSTTRVRFDNICQKTP